MHATRAIALFIALLTGSGVASQEHPDFSGHRILESPGEPRPDIPGALTVRQSVQRTDVLGKPMRPFFKEIVVERHYAGETRSQTHQIGLSGGIVGGIDSSGHLPRSESHFVRWLEDQLVIERGSYSGPSRADGPYTERTQVWHLDADGRLVITIDERSAESAQRALTLIYKRAK